MSIFQPSPASYGGPSDRDRRIRYAAQQMSGVYRKGAHYGGEWDFIGEAVSGITTGVINARTQKSLQESAYEHEQEMLELQTAAAESEAESQGRLEGYPRKARRSKVS